MGARIYELRTKAGLTQAEVAELAGISNNMLSRIERGSRNPSLHVLERLAKALDIEVHQFFNFSGIKFLGEKCSVELVDLLQYLKDRKPEEIRMIHRISQVILGQEKP